MEREVTCAEEMAAVLEQGTLCRATAATAMNHRSSRSHAIFTITLEQRRLEAAAPGGGDDDDDEGEGERAQRWNCGAAGSGALVGQQAQGAAPLAGVLTLQHCLSAASETASLCRVHPLRRRR